ncbi:response regulator [Methanobacterium sp. ACI-7]|uniref:response regulator n=1 Tax=unclassified Methanobacterium TaxID=2627676 RepID=UPI0039C4728C
MPEIKILIVKDEKILAMGLKNKLEKFGYIVTGMASSGSEAIESVKKIQPDLVLMDIVLKGEMDGIDTAKFIVNLHDIPVIYLTAYADDEILARAEKTCPYGYILKPYKDNELKANIKMALYKHNAKKERMMDFEDVYQDVTRFINENEEAFKDGIIDGLSITGPVNIDIGLNKIYISADRNNKESYDIFYQLLSNIAQYYVDNKKEITVYPKGEELCLEFSRNNII